MVPAWARLAAQGRYDLRVILAVHFLATFRAVQLRSEWVEKSSFWIPLQTLLGPPGRLSISQFLDVCASLFIAMHVLSDDVLGAPAAINLRGGAIARAGGERPRGAPCGLCGPI